MTVKDIAKQKHELLMQSIEEANIIEEALDGLKGAAFETLLLYPGAKKEGWAKMLLKHYGTELIDAYDTNPAKIFAAIDNLWNTPYHDENSGLAYTFSQWAEAFATKQSVQMYYDLIKTSKKDDL